MEKFKISFKDNVQLKYIENDSCVDIFNSIKISSNEATNNVVVKLEIMELSNRICHYIREYITNITHYPNVTIVELKIPKNEIKFDI